MFFTMNLREGLSCCSRSRGKLCYKSSVCDIFLRKFVISGGAIPHMSGCSRCTCQQMSTPSVYVLACARVVGYKNSVGELGFSLSFLTFLTEFNIG